MFDLVFYHVFYQAFSEWKSHVFPVSQCARRKNADNEHGAWRRIPGSFRRPANLGFYQVYYQVYYQVFTRF